MIGKDVDDDNGLVSAVTEGGLVLAVVDELVGELMALDAGSVSASVDELAPE